MTKRILLGISRILLGSVFVYSGFVKVIDPLGSTYKFTDYFREAFSMEWMIPASFTLAIIMSVAEMLFGLTLLANIKPRLSALGVLLFMIIFTPLTLYLAITDAVKDCGCFGDAMKISNWQTFYKNIVIASFAVLVFIFRKSYKPYLSKAKQLIVFIVLAILSFGLTWYCYEHLPLIDFRPYKVGVNITEAMTIPDGAPSDVYSYDYTLKNTKTGEEKMVDSETYVNDSTYWWDGTEWEFVTSSEPILVSKGFTPPIHDFSITSSEGENLTEDILNDDRYYFLLIAYDITKSGTSKQELINKLAEYANKNDFGFLCLSSSLDNQIEEFVNQTNAPYNFASTDETTLKTIIRANPGLILLKKGTILGKWHYNDIPEIATFEEKYLK